MGILTSNGEAADPVNPTAHTTDSGTVSCSHHFLRVQPVDPVVGDWKEKVEQVSKDGTDIGGSAVLLAQLRAADGEAPLRMSKKSIILRKQWDIPCIRPYRRWRA